MSIAIGIDLGTTNSVVSYINSFNKAIVIPNSEGKKITPSVICFKDDEIVVGEEAKELQELGIYDTVAFFKRLIGDKNFTFYTKGKEYSAIDLSSLIIKKLKKDAESFLNTSIKDAVITVPAYFKEKERQATIEAGKKAGLNILQIINEPTAAAIAYGINKHENKTILVYDLGGGTFDITILKIKKDEIEILNSEGDHQLGGKDWDDKIIAYIANKFEEEFRVDPLEDAESVADLFVRVENAKKKLTSLEKVTISISYNGMSGKYELSREIFEDLTSDLMERTVYLTQHAIESIGLSFKDIDDILLVGGSTRMPMVHSFIKERFNKNPLIGINVDEAVSIGASILANELQKKKSLTSKLSTKKNIYIGNKKIIEVTNHTLGMIAISEDKTKYINSFILPKNTKIPAIYNKEYTHKVSKYSKNVLEIYLTQGESNIPNEVEYLDKYIVTDIPYRENGIVKVLVSYSYDINGTVNIKAFVDNKELTIKKDSVEDDIKERFMEKPHIEKIIKKENITLYFAFDISGSMSDSPLAKAKKAALSFVNKMNLDYTEIGLIIFSDKVKTVLKATNNYYKIKKAIKEIECCETGCCNNAHPFDIIFKLMKNKNSEKFVIVLADGVWSCQNKAIESAKKCHKKGIEIIAIGFGSADKIFLNQIASTEEGSIFTSQDKLVESFSTIAQEISKGKLRRDTNE